MRFVFTIKNCKWSIFHIRFTLQMLLILSNGLKTKCVDRQMYFVKLFAFWIAQSITRYSFSPMADCKELSISFAYLSTHWHALTHAKDPIQLSSSCFVLLSQCIHYSRLQIQGLLTQKILHSVSESRSILVSPDISCICTFPLYVYLSTYSI